MSTHDPKSKSITPDTFMKRVEPYLRSMTALIRFRISSRDDWDDVLQNALLCAWKSIGTLRDDTNLKAWLLKICGNCCTMHIRSDVRRRNFKNSFAGAITHSGRNAMGRIHGEVTMEDRLDVERLLRHLPDTERRMMTAYYFKGLKVSEIAADENRPEGTVKRRLYAGRRRMRNILEEEPDTKKGKNDANGKQ